MRWIKAGHRVIVSAELSQWYGRAGHIAAVSGDENAPTILLQMDGAGGTVWVFPDQIDPESAVDRLADLADGRQGFVMPGLPG